MKNKKIILILLIIAVLIIIGIFMISNKFTKKITYTYIPEKAVEYSYKYVSERNPDFPNFEYNCMTYISQCLLAGGIEMDGPEPPEKINSTKIRRTSNYWYCYAFDIDKYKPIVYSLSSSFSKVPNFIKYWTKKADVPCKKIDFTENNVENMKKNVKIGDVLIFHSKERLHSALIVDITDEDIFINSNTNDRNHYPLSLVSSTEYPQLSYMNFVK